MGAIKKSFLYIISYSVCVSPSSTLWISCRTSTAASTMIANLSTTHLVLQDGGEKNHVHSWVVLTVKRKTLKLQVQKSIVKCLTVFISNAVPPVKSTPGKYFLQLRILREIRPFIPQLISLLCCCGPRCGMFFQSVLQIKWFFFIPD